MLHGMRFSCICIKLTKVWGSFLKSYLSLGELPITHGSASY